MIFFKIKNYRYLVLQERGKKLCNNKPNLERGILAHKRETFKDAPSFLINNLSSHAPKGWTYSLWAFFHFWFGNNFRLVQKLSPIVLSEVWALPNSSTSQLIQNFWILPKSQIWRKSQKLSRLFFQDLQKKEHFNHILIIFMCVFPSLNKIKSF